MTKISRFSTAWTKHKRDPKEKQDLEAAIRNSTVALTRLQEIIDEHIEAVHTAERSSQQYDNASWSHLQAHRNGELEALYNLRKLTDHLS